MQVGSGQSIFPQSGLEKALDQDLLGSLEIGPPDIWTDGSFGLLPDPGLFWDWIGVPSKGSITWSPSCLALVSSFMVLCGSIVILTVFLFGGLLLGLFLTVKCGLAVILAVFRLGGLLVRVHSRD